MSTTDFCFCDRLTQDLELKTHALRLLQERVQGSESAQLADRVATIEQQLQEASQSLSVAKSKKEEMVAAAKVTACFFSFCSKKHWKWQEGSCTYYLVSCETSAKLQYFASYYSNERHACIAQSLS